MRYGLDARPSIRQHEIGQGQQEWLPGLDTVVGAVQRGREQIAVRQAIARGIRDENRLTDLVFAARHPERQGRRLERDERPLIAEWLDIRSRLVRPALGRRVGPRVVFLPGTLGSVLVDQSLTPDQAREECRRNLGPDRDRRWRGRPWYPCDKRPETLWGTVGSLHWFFNPQLWLQRLTRGNGYNQGIPVHPDGLVDINLGVGRWGQVRPYAALLKTLRDAGADVLVVPYDWRLSNRHNARLLERRILERWYHGDPPPRERQRPEEERITFIGHSMGGLVARCFLESHPLGPVLARRLITIGTPHRGAPAAYLHLIGRTHPFPESPFAAWAHATLVREAPAAGAALQGELAAQLIPGQIQTALVRFMASAFELLPNYNFVRNQGSSEPWPDTYAQQVHHPTGEPAIRLIRRFRSGIVDERELAGWLRTRDLEYHFLGATGFRTVIGYDRGRDRLLTGREGDGTVPLDSARLQPGSTPNLRTRTLFGERDLGHQRLCQRRDVQAYCLSVLRGRRPAAPAARPAGSVAKGTRRQIDLSRATRFITVACPSQLTNKEWKRAAPSRELPLPVYKDYALMKVLYTLRHRNLNTPVHVNAFQYDQPLTPLDFTFLRDSDVIFIAGHGNDKGLYAMGPAASRGVDRLVEILTADGNLERHRRGKEIIIMLLSCRAGLGFHKGLARRLARRLSIDTIVGGAQGFTFGSTRTGPTACNEVLIRGIPWVMEYERSIPLKEAENETSAREGKTITYDGKRTEIERFLNDKRALEKAMKEVVQQLRSTEINHALNEIDNRFRSRWFNLLQAQFELYKWAKKRSNLDFDMWFDNIMDGYLWTDARKTTDQEVAALLTGTLAPADAGLTCTR
jgi:pimeloyl-ACP methyl ester carboxylesterase